MDQAATANYLAESTTANFQVNQATPTITFPDINAIYAEYPRTRPIVYISNSDGAVTYTSSDTSVATIDGSTITIVGIGPSTIEATQVATASYFSAITTANCIVGGNTPGNPVVVTSTAGFVTYLNGDNVFGQLNASMDVPSGGLISQQPAKTFTASNESVTLTKQ